MNAFLLAATQTPDRQINGMNHAFLPLAGRPLLIYVLMALDRVTQIDQTVVIGPPREIMRAIESVIFEIPFQKKIVVIEEQATLRESLSFADAQSRKRAIQPDGLNMLSEPALILPGHIPFVTPAEISTFIAAADMTTADCCLSIAADAAFRFSDLEQNKQSSETTIPPSPCLGSLLLARADCIGDPNALKIIEERYQKNRGADSSHTTRLEAFLKWINARDEKEPQETLPPLSEIEKNIAAFLKTRFKFIETASAGNALPAKNPAAYRFLVDHFEAWRNYITGLKTEQGEKVCSISGRACESHGHEHNH